MTTEIQGLHYFISFNSKT